MSNQVIFELKKKVNDEVILVKSLPLDAQQASYFAKYLVVYLSGMYEELIEKIIYEWAESFHNNELEKYIKTTVSNSFQNPKINNIQKLLLKFHPDWGQEILVVGESNLTAIDSIVNNKNLLAHGGLVTLTLNDVCEYHEKAIIVIEKIEEVFGLI